MLDTTRHLSTFEIKALEALTDEFMSPSVIKIRAGYTSSAHIDVIHDACIRLERLGLAEYAGSGRRSKNRWRRARCGDFDEPSRTRDSSPRRAMIPRLAAQE